MKNKIIPITGLPRSGSTLLLSILNQNPIFNEGSDSVISKLLINNHKFINQNIHHMQLPNDKVNDCFLSFCRCGIESWLNLINSENFIFLDKAREWIINLDFIFKLFPSLKIIITIRDLRGIFNSFEKVNNNSLFTLKYNFNQNFYENFYHDFQFQRIKKILDMDGLCLKEGLITLKEIIEVPKKYKNNLFISKYEDLILNPQQHLLNLYNFLELEVFDHDFKNIPQIQNNDNVYMPYGNHKIKNFLDSKNLYNFSELKQESIDFIAKEFDWYYNNYYTN